MFRGRAVYVGYFIYFLKRFLKGFLKGFLNIKKYHHFRFTVDFSIHNAWLRGRDTLEQKFKLVKDEEWLPAASLSKGLVC